MMKHIKLFENIEDEMLPDNIKLVDVGWNGIFRNFNNETEQLGVGDLTDKGTILKKIDGRGIDLNYTTYQGTFRANKFKVYTSDNWWDLQEFIKIKTDINKYNI